jgi:hypothetical protein
MARDRRRGAFNTQHGNRFQNTAAMAKRSYAYFLEVVGRQVGKRSASTSFSWNADSWRSRPRFRSQLASTAVSSG